MAVTDDILTPQQRHMEQLRTPVPQLSIGPTPDVRVPQQQPQVVDRVAYIQQQVQARKEAEAEARQNAVFARRIQAIQSPEFQQGINQMFQQGADIVGANVGTQSALAIARQHARQSGVLTSDDPRAKYLQQLIDTDPTQYLIAVGEPGLIPGQVPTVGVTGALKNIYKAGELPFMEPVRQRVGQAAGVAAEAAMQATPGLAIAQKIGEELPGVPTPKGLAVGAAESTVPTNVWQVALELVPGIGTVPGASSALSRALKEGGYDLTAAGVRKFLAAEGTQGAMKKILAATASERGALQVVRQAEDLGGPVSPDAATIASLTEQRARITQALQKLSKGEKSRMALGNVADAMKIAARYDTGSEKREALITLIEPHIAHLPEVQQKFIRESLRTLPSQEMRKAATKAQRLRQFSAAHQAFEETPGTITEKTIASYKAKGGKQAQQFTPLGGKFTPEETQDLLAEIVRASQDGRISRVFDRDEAISAMTLLMTGERLPGVRSEALKPLNLAPYEIKHLGKVFGPQFEAAIPRTASHMGKFDQLVDIVNLPRAIVTALDFSAAGRQGILLAARNPKEWWGSLGPMLRAMMSEEGFARVAENIRRNAKFEDALIHGLDLTTPGGGVLAEEPFISGMIAKIPTKAGGGLIRGSERGYVAFLDNMRMLTYEKYANRVERLATKHGWDVERTSMVKHNIASFLNHASGRGDISGAQRFAPALNAAFFSPRFVVSRPQSIWDMVRPGADRTTRQIAFENLVSFVGLGVGMLETAKLMGADVEYDPRSSDFGKMKFGDQRIDFWGGFQPIARYVAQALTMRQKELFTGDVKYAYPGTTALRFFRSKLGPGGALIYDYTAGGGKTYTGDDLFFSDPSALGLNKETRDKAWNDFAQRIVPLSIQDAIEGYFREGIVGGLVAGGISSAGGGVSSFAASEEQQKDVDIQQFEQEALVPLELSIDRGKVSFDFEPSDDRRKRMAAEMFDGDTLEGLSVKEIQDKWIAERAELFVADGMPEQAAKAEATRLLGLFETVKEADRDRDAFARRTWEEHPEILKRALELGLTDPAAYKNEILEKAGLR